MSRNRSFSMKMVSSKSKHKVITCSTPEHQADSPSRDSDSMCDSEAASPVPFLCTQDGTDGETDVIWNYNYTPNSKHAPKTQTKNSTPLSRKTKKSYRPKVIEKQLPRRRPVMIPHKTELFQELLELNRKLPELLAKKSQPAQEPAQSGSEDDIFNESPDQSPKTGLRNTSRCLRKNVLSSKFAKPELEAALESDDSMNECLIKASQIVEEKFIEHKPSSPKRVCYDKYYSSHNRDVRTSTDFRMDHDSMDAILNSIKLESPAVKKAKKFDSPKIGNDSFDSFVGNLNDSALEQLTQMPIRSISNSKPKTGNDSDRIFKKLIVHDGSPTSKSVFARHSSMPESPCIENNKPSTSGMVFGRFNSMPYDKNESKNTGPSDSPIRCTPDEIKRKHQLARERLLAKRQLPFTSTQKSTQSLPEATQQSTQNVKNSKFQPRIPSSTTCKTQNNNTGSNSHDSQQKFNSNMPLNTKTSDIKLLIEKKRQEALVKLRRRQPK